MNLIDLITRQANAVGKPGGVKCEYGWSRQRSRFQWTFYRNGHVVGSTSRHAEVIRKVERLTRAS